MSERQKDITHLNSILDDYEARFAYYTNHVKDLESQLKPREDDKGKCIVKIMESIEENKQYIGDGAYTNLMNMLGQEYNKV